jgi:hypothetical protein
MVVGDRVVQECLEISDAKVELLNLLVGAVESVLFNGGFL